LRPLIRETDLHHGTMVGIERERNMEGGQRVLTGLLVSGVENGGEDDIMCLWKN
jgi:hypothetical protein